MKLTGQITTTISSLSEGIFWDFKEQQLSKDVFNYFGFDTDVIPELKDVFTEHGTIHDAVAEHLSLPKGVPVTYKSGDQPNNALSLNVLDSGEVAATAGTSGVIYGVSDQLVYDQQSRINSFAHVNFTEKQKRIGVLLCINGTGILNSWIKNVTGNKFSYGEMNEAAANIQTGSNGLQMLPFGNGAERMLENKLVQSHIHNIDFNVHKPAHLFRAAQEGIAFAFRYGLDIMRENGMLPLVIRVGKANMFLSSVFTNCFVNATNVPVELHDCDGSVGAAKGAGIGVGYYKTAKEAFTNTDPLNLVEPTQAKLYDEFYGEWKELLNKNIN
jgi:xylulokinase